MAVLQASCWRPGRSNPPASSERMRQLAEARQGSWLGEGWSSVQQQALRDFDRAMRNYFAGTHRRPTRRKKGRGDGFCVRDLSVTKINRRWATIHVPKVGPVRFRLSRPIPAEARSARVTMDRAGRWHVSFPSIPMLTEGPGTGEVVGIDRGVVNTLALSTGEVLHAPEPSPTVKRLQRGLSRQKKGSNRRKATKLRLAKLHARDADRRRDFVEKASTDLARRFDIVRIEDLKVRQMMRSARGTTANPGRRVRQKAGLNRSIAEQCWGLFAQRLGHKIGDRLELVPAAYTSQTCSCCGVVDREARESQADFRCRACGHSEHADVNAARNIAAGRAANGRGGMVDVRPPGEPSSSAA